MGHSGGPAGVPRTDTRSSVGQRARRLDPPLLTEGPLSGAVFVVTVGKVLDGGMVESTTKYDVTDQFDALARRRGWTPPVLPLARTGEGTDGTPLRGRNDA
jgi:hypothetical protein